MKLIDVKAGDPVFEERARSLWNQSGVYVACIPHHNIEPIYVGESRNLGKRLLEHRKGFESTRRTFPRLRNLGNPADSWLVRVLKHCGDSPSKEAEGLYVPTAVSEPNSAIKQESQEFWKTLKIFVFHLNESGEIQLRRNIEATLQREFTKFLLGNYPIKDDWAKDYQIPLLQAPHSRFLGRRQGEYLGEIPGMNNFGPSMILNWLNAQLERHEAERQKVA